MSAILTRRRRMPRFVVSALFDAPGKVDEALARLYEAGVPRDLIEVVVSPAAAKRHYGGKARARKNEAFRYAGVGGVIGVVFGALLGLGVIAWPGFAPPGVLALVQLIGPNVATVGGALLGLVIGAFVKRKPELTHRRAGEAREQIIVVVVARSEAEVRAMSDLFLASGGTEPRLERVDIPAPAQGAHA